MADMPSPHGGSGALDELCDYAAAWRHHELRADVQQVAHLLEPLAGDAPPAPEILEQYQELAAFLELHLSKEENILFPALVSLAEAARAGQPRPPCLFRASSTRSGCWRASTPACTNCSIASA